MRTEGEPAPEAHPANPSIDRLAALVLLQRKARQAKSEAELFFVAVNDTSLLLPAPVILLYTVGRASQRLGLSAVSGLPQPEASTPFSDFATRLSRHFTDYAGEPLRIDPVTLPADVRQEWPDFLPPDAVWLPLQGRSAAPNGGLLLARQGAWNDAELRLLIHWGEALGHGIEHIRLKRGLIVMPIGRKPLLLAGVALVALLALAFLPVHLQVLASAEVVPKDPVVVRSPIAGVVERVLVEPNAAVRANDRLLQFDVSELNSRRDVAQQALETATAELRQAQQQAIMRPDAQAMLPVLQARMEQRRAEVAYTDSLLSRAAVVAPRDGIAIFADATSWQGRPVKLGERILVLAEPSQAELEIWIPVADALDLAPGSDVDLYLNVDPERAIRARFRLANYQASQGPDGVLGFHAVADFDGLPPRIGLHGTAKISGPRVVLGYALIRRPLAYLRQALGL